MLPVRRVVEVRRAGGQWGVFERRASGSVVPPAHATRTADGALVWTEADYHLADVCPACVSPRPCVQRTEARANGSLFIEHEHTPPRPN